MYSTLETAAEFKYASLLFYEVQKPVKQKRSRPFRHVYKAQKNAGTWLSYLGFVSVILEIKIVHTKKEAVWGGLDYNSDTDALVQSSVNYTTKWPKHKVNHTLSSTHQ